jgi:tRNA(fMet)-specific endonuclease VapC
MDKALLDTDIFSEITRRRNPNVVAASAACLAVFGHHTISVLTVVEIVKGFHRHRQEPQIQRFLNLLPQAEVLPLDVTSAELAGRIVGDLERTGQPIGRADPLIAAIAWQHDLTLVTGNQAHFQRIQALGYALKLANWRA